MTRIVGGFAGSLTLEVPRSGTRPTSDMVREAVFSALVARDVVQDARVLDLYAGSGALGLEAASRGAASVTLVDSAAAAASACRKNAARVGRAAPAGHPVAIEVNSAPALAFAKAARQFWDLVFIDPPYELASDEVSALLSALVPRLAPGAIVVLERSARSAPPEWPGDLELDRRKDYGDTALYWLSPL